MEALHFFLKKNISGASMKILANATSHPLPSPSPEFHQNQTHTKTFFFEKKPEKKDKMQKCKLHFLTSPVQHYLVTTY